MTYHLGADEPPSEGVVMAFDSLGIDVCDLETRLYDWVDIDVLDALGRTTETFELSIPVREYRVVLTQDSVTIHRPSVDG